MAEVVTAVGLLASIAQLMSSTAKAFKYLNDVKNAPKERTELSLEAAVLVPLMAELRSRVENSSTNDPWLDKVKLLGGPGGFLEQLTAVMEKLTRKLKPGTGMNKISKQLIWTFNKDEIHGILIQIQRFNSYLLLALEQDHMKLSKAIKAETTGIKSLTDNVDKVSNKFDQCCLNDDSRAKVDYLQDVMAWLAPVDFGKSHSNACEAWAEGTGRWFLDSPEFGRWQNGTNETLFCPGILGAGKTVIASLAINHLREKYSNDHTAVLYMYCFYEERPRQTPASIVAGLLKQMVETGKAVSDEIRALHQQHSKEKTYPTQVQLATILKSEVRRYSKVFIVIDALDEASDHGVARDLLLSEIQSFRDVSNMMLTSRFLSPIMEAFQDAVHLTISADYNDVRQYLKTQIPTLPRCVRSKPYLQELIIDTIAGVVDGMFLLARFHMQSLTDKFDARKIKDALARLPRGSGSSATDTAYSDTIKRINSQEEGFQKLAFNVLSWVTLARRPLSVRELQYAISIETGDTNIAEDNLVDEDTMTSACAGLVVIDQKTHTICLAHRTVKEFFELRKDDMFPDAETKLATTCVTYLLFNEFSSWRTNDLVEKLLENKRHDISRVHEFFDYAAQFWGYHARSSKGAAIEYLILTFLEEKQCLAFSLYYLEDCSTGTDHQSPAWYSDIKHDLPHRIYKTYATVKFGLRDMRISDELLEPLGDLAGVLEGSLVHSLCLAVVHRQESVVRKLLKRTANVVIPAANRAALAWPLLHTAILNCKDDIATFLLECGASTAQQDEEGNTALHCAAANRLFDAGGPNIVRHLISKGADINAVNNIGWTPLHVAAAQSQNPCGWPRRWRGKTHVMMMLLLRNSAMVDAHRDRGRTAFFFAPEDSRLLLEFDLDVDMKGDAGHVPIHYAVEFKGAAMASLQAWYNAAGHSQSEQHLASVSRASSPESFHTVEEF